MNMTKKQLREIIKKLVREIITEKEVSHDCATHVEFKNPVKNEGYGIGEVIHHTLFEDGSVTKYSAKFGNRTVKNIPVDALNIMKERHHSHGVSWDDDEKEGDAI